jgi:hypothetical protein
MTVATDPWISDYTEQKEADFRRLLGMHVRVCQAIMARYGGQPYLYVDLYAGPGRLEYEGREFDGSPLIARDTLAEVGLPYRGVHFDRDPEVADRLHDALGLGAEVYDMSCQEGFPEWLAAQPRQSQRLGLVYSDPINDEIPHDLLNAAAQKFPKVDLLSYVAATQYKRRRGTDPTRPYLADHIAAVDKRVVLVREPLGAWHWTFILWTNWADLKEWRRRGFYRLDSRDGERVLDRLNLSKREAHEAANTPLPLFEEA